MSRSAYLSLAYLANAPLVSDKSFRRHIKQRHSGPGILSLHYCSTCKEEFPSPTLLDEHAKQGACVYRELPSSNDPLDGLSPEAERTLRSKQGRQGDSALCQYKKICQIALGDSSDVHSPGKLPPRRCEDSEWS